MIKDATQPYPTRAGQRIWHKLKSRRSLDMLAVGVVSDPVAPTSLVLAMKTLDDEPRAAGATAILTRAGPLRGTDRPWPGLHQHDLISHHTPKPLPGQCQVHPRSMTGPRPKGHRYRSSNQVTIRPPRRRT